MSGSKKQAIADILFSITQSDLQALDGASDPSLLSLVPAKECSNRQLHHAVRGYALGIQQKDVVALSFGDLLKSGKKGILFSTHSFTGSDLNAVNSRRSRVSLPIPYDSLDHVSLGPELGEVILHYRDGKQAPIFGNIYAAFLVLAVNRILEALFSVPVPSPPQRKQKPVQDAVPPPTREKQKPARDAAPPPTLTADELFQRAMALYHGDGIPQDHTAAVQFFRQAAELGHPSAQYNLALMLDNGDGIPVSQEEAAIWYEKVAAYGYAPAQYTLAEMHRTGSGVPKDQTRAAQWYRKAAEQGHGKAQHTLACCYYQGIGVPENQTEAAIWFRKAAEQGFAEDQFALAVMLENGSGIPKDHEEALSWYERAAAQGHERAQDFLEELNAKMKPDIFETPEEQYLFALHYYHGKDLPQDRGKAVQLLGQAASGGHADAQFLLGTLYAKGEVVPKNMRTAALWYEKAAEQGVSGAQLLLASLYEEGKDIPIDLAKAAYWYEKAAFNGEAFAQYKTAWMYDMGILDTQSPSLVAYWYEKAAEQGDLDAQHELAILYYKGKGVPQDRKKALSLMEMAAVFGHEESWLVYDEWTRKT